MVWQSEVAHQMALIPLGVLGVIRVRGARRDAAWWWLAGAFAVSWLADTAADFMPPADSALPSLVYPVTQSAIIGAVLLPRPDALYFLATMVAVTCAVVVFNGVGPDAILRTAAWLLIVGIVLAQKALPSRLRLALLVYFGLGWVTWLIHVHWIVVATWYPYQLARLVGLLLFCWAMKPHTNMRIVSS